MGGREGGEPKRRSVPIFPAPRRNFNKKKEKKKGVQNANPRAWEWGAEPGMPPDLFISLLFCHLICRCAADSPLWSRHKGGVQPHFPRRHLFKKYLKIFKKLFELGKKAENDAAGVLYRDPYPWSCWGAPGWPPEVKFTASLSRPAAPPGATFPRARQGAALSKIN